MTNDDTQPQDDEALVKCTEELVAAREEAAKWKEVAARNQAEMQNARTRADREAEESRKYALESALRRLLPTLDNFQRGVAHLPEELQDNEWVKGILATEGALLKELSALGLTRMNSLGAAVDAQKHEVLMTGPGKAGTVIEVFEEGYELNGKVIRVAKVKAGA